MDEQLVQILNQIEDGLNLVSGRNIIPAADVENLLLDLMQSFKALAKEANC
jgi:hypothetical protein